VLHEFLPAKQILWRQHIEPVAFCEVCGDPVESIRHVLVDCTVAREFWKHIRVATGTKLPRLNSVAWTADLLLGVCSKRDRAFILIVTKFLGRWGRGTGSRYVVRYSREILHFGSKMNP
jgi:hypothetical protein